MCGQNFLFFDRQVLAHHGYALTPHWEDTLLAASILDPQLPRNLGALVANEFHAEAHKAAFRSDKESGVLSGWESTDLAVERERRVYCLKDAYTTLLLWKRQKERLKDYGQSFYDDLKRLSVIAVEMRQWGAEWDPAEASRLATKYDAQLQKALGQLQKVAAPLGFVDFNPGSPKQLRDLFYVKCKVAPTIWTEKHEPSTSEDALVEMLKADNAFVKAFAEKLMEYREAQKRLGTYIIGMAPESGSRISGDWRAHTAISGRWSCTGRPLQTLDEELRGLIKVSPDCLMVECDLPSAEVRSVMLFAKADEVIRMLNDGGDLYSWAATDMFGMPVSKKDKTAKFRQLGKLIILASHYAAQAPTVWRQIIKREIEIDGEMVPVWKAFPALGVRQVEVLQRRYFEKVPAIPRWWETEETASAARGYYFSPLDGRKLHFYGPVDRPLMANYPNQSGIAAYMNAATLRVRAQMTAEDRIIALIHDAITAETKAPQIDRLRQLLVSEMEGDINLDGRTILMRPVEFKVGKNMREVK